MGFGGVCPGFLVVAKNFVVFWSAYPDFMRQYRLRPASRQGTCGNTDCGFALAPQDESGDRAGVRDLCEPEELLCMLRWLLLLKFNKQIMIAFFWIEPVIGRMPEQQMTAGSEKYS